MSEKLSQLVRHLVETYHPKAIILHGSRARGTERPHSDWDFMLLSDVPIHVETVRNSILDENVEVKVFLLPVEKIIKTFGEKLRGGKAVYDPEGIAAELLRQAEPLYEAPLNLSSAQRRAQILHIQGRLYGMKETIENAELFFDYLGDFYKYAMNLWFETLHNMRPLPPTEALPYIHARDPKYYGLLRILSSAVSNREKLDAAEKIYNRLAGKVAGEGVLLGEPNSE
ncbi:MAG: hypothetical protein G01um101472_177 [Parcubacteria group bacterium Gr01-1014_72]|nr:MAG: hypothetical protein G01um101472_177 [Parcubacteria group bacterium Gr01-1014_72]